MPTVNEYARELQVLLDSLPPAADTGGRVFVSEPGSWSADVLPANEP